MIASSKERLSKTLSNLLEKGHPQNDSTRTTLRLSGIQYIQTSLHYCYLCISNQLPTKGDWGKLSTTAIIHVYMAGWFHGRLPNVDIPGNQSYQSEVFLSHIYHSSIGPHSRGIRGDRQELKANLKREFGAQST